MVTPRRQREWLDHAVTLQGIGAAGPSIVQRTDEDFLAAFLHDLEQGEPTNAVRNGRPPQSRTGTLRLFQPVHRVFHLAVTEAHCDRFGNPRLDPASIESAGLVLRRVIRNPDGSTGQQAWCTQSGRVLGWRALDPASLDRDPEPARRQPLRLTGDLVKDAELAGSDGGEAEAVTSMFTVPQPVIDATRRTLLYGVLPLTSSSRAGAPTKGVPASRENWEAHVSRLLKAAANPVALWPAGTDAQRREKLGTDDLVQFPVRTEPEPDATTNPGATRFVLLVRQLAQEFSLLRPANPATRAEVIAELNRLQLVLVDGSTAPAGDYLLNAARFYFEESLGKASAVSTLARPRTWPAIDANRATRLLDLLRRTTDEIELSLLAPANAGGKFDDPAARYVIRAFVRVKQPCDCPAKLVWTGAVSEEFTIVPWHESGPVAPPTVSLPDPFEKGFLQRARPGVTFNVPASLANFLNQDPKKLLAGEGKRGGGLALDWICGFNIPIITICAFIVLNIFLNLLNLIFWWLPFVKICIPFPRPAPPEPEA